MQRRPAEALNYLAEFERDFGSEDVDHDWFFLLPECGRTEEALVRARAHPHAGSDDMLALAARLLEALGRGDEAIALLRPHVASRSAGAAMAEILLRRGEVDKAMAAVRAATA